MNASPNWFPIDASDSLEKEIRSEKADENARNERFQEKFPRISRLPVLYRFFCPVYAHGIPYLLGLLVVIVIFTAIKVPYLHVLFTGDHSMKNNPYVITVIYMGQ